ncbi:hypothetical protein J2X97_000698 [Epilithonimonas hungarica]|uniref:hypothetical protein n=1 Tax=Epilithonimonas hungarica TaxID=454006 RepID=UPI00277DDD41|nr:hypothetical protein [Epilithonimonas hungarica]MDP9955061.1 hypothetical protein [Epilithonimonas hungarica]
MKKNSKEIIAGALIVLLISLTAVIFYIINYLSQKVVITPNWILFILIYIISSFIIALLSVKIRKKYLRICIDIYLAPLFALISIAGLLLPVISLLFHYSLYLMICFAIPGIVIAVLSYFHILTLSAELKIYLIFTFAVFIAVIFNNILRRFVQRLSSLYTASYSFANNAKLDSLTDYVASQNVVKFLIYSIYFILLILTNIYKLQNQSLYASKNYYVAILQSFVTFLAFDKVYGLSGQLDFKFSNFLSMIIYSIRSITNFSEKDNSKEDQSKL